MTDDQARHGIALIAAACLIGPTIPPALVVNRPNEAATALTRMADLLIPWLEGDPPASAAEEASDG